MKDLKFAKKEDIPLLEPNGSNYGQWKASFLGFYSGQSEHVMRLALGENVKTDEKDDQLTMSTIVMKSICPELRQVYVLRPDLLNNGFELFEELKLRFEDDEEEMKDLEIFLSMKQGNSHLGEYLAEYTNMFHKRRSQIQKIMNDDNLTEHLERSLNDRCQGLFPYGARNFEETVKILRRKAKKQSTQRPARTAFIAKKKKICYKCGSQDHMRRECPHEEVRCFKCKKFGHIAASCPLND